MNNQICDGTTIDFTPTADVASGQLTLVGKLPVVALSPIKANEEGTGVAEGVFELPKVAADDIAQGAQLYVKADGMLTTTASGNTAAGKAWAAAGNGADTVWAKINA